MWSSCPPGGQDRIMIYGQIILILLGYLESQVWAQVPGLFVLFGIGVASLLTGKRRT
jgi:hypothetical protein